MKYRIGILLLGASFLGCDQATAPRTESAEMEIEPLEAQIVWGRVVDHVGEGIPHADIRIVAEQPGSWLVPRRQVVMEAKTDQSGAFELRGERPRGELTLHAEKDFYQLREPRPIPGRPSDVELVLEPRGTIWGKIELGGIPSQSVEVRLEGHAPIAPQGDGYFEFNVLPGEYEVSIWLRGHDQPLARVAGAESKTGELQFIDELMSIDIRQKVGHVNFRVLDSEGSPIRRARLFEQSEGGWKLAAVTNALGERTVVRTPGAQRYKVGMIGYGMVTLVDPPVEATVVLPDAMSVEVVRTGFSSLPEPVAVEFYLEAKEEDEALPSPWSEELLARGERLIGDSDRVSVAIAAPGTYRAGWRLIRTDQPLDRENPDLSSLREITIEDGVAGQVLELPLTKADIDALYADG